MLVQALKSCHGNIDNQDNEGWTAMMEAARRGANDALQSLISAGANPDMCSPLGWTPLAMAVSHHQEESIKILLNAGADSSRMIPMGDEYFRYSKNDWNESIYP